MKKLKISRADTCRSCGIDLPKGTQAWWDSSAKAIHCVPCVDGPGPSAEQPAVDEERPAAGRSARDEYERRATRERAKQEQAIADDAAWRKEAIEARPVLGRVATALTAKPKIQPEKQSTTAWKVGAEGEERVAEVLTGVAGIEALHDRRVPRSKANIDHLVVGPAGVFVVDAKKYKEGLKMEVRNRGGVLRPDHRLYVGGRDRTKLVDAVLRQVEVVRTALGPDLAEIPVRGVLCFIGQDWGWRPKTKTVRGVTAVWPLGLADVVTVDGPHADAVKLIAEHLRAALPPASR